MSNVRSRIQHTLRWLAVLSVVTTIAYGIIVYAQVNALRTKTRAAEADAMRFEMCGNNISVLESKLIELRENVRAYLDEFPDDRETSSILNNVNEFATYTGVTIVSVDSKKERPTCEGLETTTFRIQLTGRPNELSDFADLQECHEDRSHITYLDIVAPEKSSPNLQATLQYTRLSYVELQGILATPISFDQ